MILEKGKIMKKIAASIILLGLFSTSQAEDSTYIPIHNLTPIRYNTATINYNPQYDNYTWLTPIQAVQQANSASTSNENEYQKIKADYTGKHLDALKNATNLGDFFSAAIQGNQDRAEMDRLTGTTRTKVIVQQPIQSSKIGAQLNQNLMPMVTR